MEQSLSTPNPHCSRVAAVLLNWNNADDTLSCISSLANSTYPHDLVVVDNGSTDDSMVRLRAHAGIELLQTGHNLGFAGGCNIGILAALERGADWVWLLNNDTLVAPDTLAQMVEVAAADREIGVVGSVIYDYAPPNAVQAWGGGRIQRLAGRSQHAKTAVCGALDYIVGSSMLLRGAALESVGMLDPSFFLYWEDADLSFRFRAAGWKLIVAKHSSVWHKENGTIGKKSPQLDFFFNQSARLFFSRYSKYPIIPIAAGVSLRLLKRAVSRDWERFRATLRGVLTPPRHFVK
jgi:GT2 family glycosyltransferase